MKIKKIKIEYIRGLESREFEMNLHPNKPSIFVAPNGFGKTSLATAFNSLTSTSINVNEENIYKNNIENIPSLTIVDENENVYQATPHSNTIKSTFSIAVINSRIKPKASNRHFSGFTASSPQLTVEPIILYNTIPSTKELEYNFSSIKIQLGSSMGKLLKNFTPFKSIPSFIRDFVEMKPHFEKLSQVKNKALLTDFANAINSQNGTKQRLINSSIDITTILSINSIQEIKQKFSRIFNDLSDIEIIANIIQLKEIYVCNKNDLNGILKYYNYIADKQEINEMMGFFNCTWKNIRASKKDGKYIIEFPKANQISNGERDILCFIGKLFEARRILTKSKSILIIDEIFDYLDDANLIAAQYFLNKFIENFSQTGREIFPIILTHLDPMFFNTYSFSTKNIVYLDSIKQTTNKYKINNLLKERAKCKKENNAMYDLISSQYLHFSIENELSATTYLASIGVEETIQSPEGFREKAFEELNNYIEGQNYDLALVCCGLRLYIEKTAYIQRIRSINPRLPKMA